MAGDGLYMSATVGGIMENNKDKVVEKNNNNNNEEVMEQPDESMERLDDAAGTVKILIGYMQVFSSFDMTLQIPWPESFKNMINFFQFINVDLFSFFGELNMCGYVIPFYDSFMTHMMVLPIVLGIAAVAGFIALLINRKKYKTKFYMRQHFDWIIQGIHHTLKSRVFADDSLLMTH